MGRGGAGQGLTFSTSSLLLLFSQPFSSPQLGPVWLHGASLERAAVFCLLSFFLNLPTGALIPLGDLTTPETKVLSGGGWRLDSLSASQILALLCLLNVTAPLPPTTLASFMLAVSLSGVNLCLRLEGGLCLLEAYHLAWCLLALYSKTEGQEGARNIFMYLV